MKNQLKPFIYYFFICITVFALNGCKELDQILDTEETTDNDSTLNGGLPGYNGSADEHPGHSHSEAMGHFAPAALDLNSLKINGIEAPFNFTINSRDNWHLSNKTPVILNGNDINTVDVAVSSRNENGATLGFFEIRLFSMVDHQSVYISFMNLGVADGQVVTTPETHFNAYYENPRNGIYNSIYDQATAFDDFFKIENSVVSLNISMLLDHLAMDHTQMGISSATDSTSMDSSVHVHKVAARAVADTDTSMSAQTLFFMNDLFSLGLYVDGELVVNNVATQNISNCVFSSMDTPPVDIDDICRAYLSVNK